MSEELEGVVFDDMSVEELQGTIVKYVKEIRKLNKDKKEFCDGIKDVTKELNLRVGAALEVLDRKKAKVG